MKKRLFVVLLIFTTCVRSQVIDSIVVRPTINPAPGDTITILIFSTFTYGACYGTAYHNISGSLISSSSIHCLGALAVICHDVDTVILFPPHTAGTYTFTHSLSVGFGGPPCSPGIIPNDHDTITFVVGNPPNAAPSVSPLPGDTVCKNAVFGPIQVTITDEDTNSLTVVAKTDNPSLLPLSAITITPGGGTRYLTANPVANVTGSVNITVVVTDNALLKDSSTFNLLVKDCASGVDNLRSQLIRISPNPVRDMMRVMFDPSVSDPRIEILDLRGRPVLLSTEYSGREFLVHTTSLSNGIYILRFYSGNNVLVTRRFDVY